MNIRFISAGAGSGKTYTLTELLYEKLAEGKTRPAGVIATTFTKKAATELRERVREKLLEKRRFDLANRIGQARIGTVHSVCGDLLARFSFELGLSPDLRIVEESQAQALLNQAIDAAVTEGELREINQLERRLSIHDWMANRDWRSELKALVDQARANNLGAEELQACGSKNADTLLGMMGPTTQDDLDAELKSALRLAIENMEPRQAEKPQKNIGDYLSAAKALMTGLEQDEAPWSDWQAIAKQKSAASFNVEVENVARAGRRCEQHPRLRADLRRYLELIFTLASKTLSCYATHKAELGVLDFTDQECQILAALDLPLVADVLRDELDLLLVDEFQDTSPIQLALFLKLAALARETYWVGDIKQAIYAFRGSDTALMSAIVDKVPELGGKLETPLPYSWRSRPALVDLVNAVFVPAFANSLEAAIVRLEPKRQDRLAEAALARWSLEGKKVSDQATALATGIAGLVASGFRVIDKKSERPRTVGYADVAVLCRANAGVQRVAQALRAQGIPAAIAQPGLLAQPEAALAVACLRRLNDPSDTIASAEIVSMTGEPPEAWLADRLKLAAQHPERGDARDRALNAWYEDRHPILKQLATLRQEQMSLLAPREALQLAMVKCDLPRTVLGWQNDPIQARTRLANLEALLDLAGQYEESCRNDGHPATVSGLLLWLQEQAKTGTDALAEPSVEAVQVMTHHKAKGLEWPVVILMDLEDDVRDRIWSISAETQGNTVDAAHPLKDRFIRYWPWPFGKQKKDVELADRVRNLDIGQQLRSQAIEEEKRLLYVSMTRARDLLIFAWPGEDKTGEWFESVSAPWLALSDEAHELTLPDGKVIPCVTQTFEPPECGSKPDEETSETKLHWFQASAPEIKRLPLVFNPSASDVATGKLAEQQDLGSPITVAKGAEMNVLGTAIHACIAAAVVDRELLKATDVISEILCRHQANAWIESESVQRQLLVFFDWIETCWPNSKVLAEVPTEAVFENGQVLQGRIDMLIQTERGWIVIDHKSNQADVSRWDELARNYAGQLAAYAKAVQQASGIPVIETWLFLPVSAGMIRVVADN